jgi:hypothetical protein
MKKLFCAFTCALALQCITGSALAGIRVQLKDNDGTTTSEWMRLEFKLVNDQPAAYDLTNTTLRYYFRDTSKVWSTAVWSFLVNSSTWSTSSVTATVAAEPLLQDGWVLTLKFSGGKINANSDAWVLAGAHNENWKVNELDDYSYLTGTVFQDDGNVALYHGDQRLFGPQVLAAPAGNGASFTSGTNPIISYNSRKHYSSDPVAAVVPTASGNSVLYLATSTDLYSSTSCGTSWWPPNWVSNCAMDYPMDGVHVYTTIGPNVGGAQWFEAGNVLADNTVAPIFKLQDFAAAGAKVSSNTMFAPDLQFVPTQGKMYMYVPMPDTTGHWQIGTASAGLNIDGLFGSFTQSSQFLSLSHGPVFNAPAGPVDPGVFPAMDSSGHDSGDYFMMYVDTPNDNSIDPNVGNISMAHLHSDMTSGDFMGKLRFAAPYSHYERLVRYMEGPDVAVMSTKSGRPYYYMVFTAGDGGEDTQSVLIGYAMASKDDFDNDPLHCWNFKGWIFKGFGTGNNHANLVQYNDKYYIFYHQGNTTKGDHQRQVWAKEIALVDNPTSNAFLPSDGEIVGVTRPTPDSMDQLGLYVSLNVTTTSINRATRYIRNAINSDVTWSYATLADAATFQEGDGIYNRFLTDHSTNQEWVIEDVSAGTMVGSVAAPANAVRIRNMLTPDKRMTCGAAYNSDSDGTNFGLFNNTLNAASANQVWIKEQGGDAPSAIRLRSLWNNNSNTKFYMTRIASGPTSDTYCKAAVSANTQRQEWFIE